MNNAAKYSVITTNEGQTFYTHFENFSIVKHFAKAISADLKIEKSCHGKVLSENDLVAALCSVQNVKQ